MWNKLIFCILSVIFIVSGAPVMADIPRGLSDTALQRAWDSELENQKTNEIIDFNDDYDTPTPQQYYQYLCGFTNVTKQDSSPWTPGDTLTVTVMFRQDLPYKLHIEEEYSDYGVLIRYEKLIKTE